VAAQTVGFAIADEDRPQLDALVEHFGHGNRSEFLRVAMKRMRHEMWAEKMRDIQARGRAETGGRVVSRQEVSARIAEVLGRA
jgi:Arc/MetJ-type ribon-helix-helix transcriptional regulator